LLLETVFAVFAGKWRRIVFICFFDCRLSWLTWNICFARLGITTVVPFHALSHFPQFRLSNAPESVNLGFGNIWIAMVNEIWCHRNKIVFNEEVLNLSEIFYLAQLKVWDWLTSKFPSASFLFSDWCLAPLVCLYSL